MARERLSGVVIIEGCDGTGKTTLAEEICKRHMGKYVHLAYIKDHRELFEKQAMELVHASKREGVTVIDRHWPSENVYAHVCRGDNTLGAAARMMDRVMLRLGGVYVLARHDSPEVNESVHQANRSVREEMYDNITEVARRFDRLWNGGEDSAADYCGALIRKGGVKKRVNWVGYNYTKNSIGDCIIEIERRLKFIRANQVVTGLIAEKANWLGHAGMCNTILVGDREKEKLQRYKWPFFRYDKPSMFLCAALQLADVDESRLCWTNALEEGADVSIRAVLLASRKRVRVVAMGKVAEKWLKDHGFEVDATVLHCRTAIRELSVQHYSIQLQEAIQ